MQEESTLEFRNPRHLTIKTYKMIDDEAFGKQLTINTHSDGQPTDIQPNLKESFVTW